MNTINYDKRHLKTVSLFSGAGGLDYGFLNAGFDIIWANDFNKYAVQSYKANIGNHILEGDIDELWEQIPEHDVLVGGFPCQPFSMMGQKQGFNDERGTLFFTIEKILEKHKTKIVVLENVKGLETHDNGNTFHKMIDILSNKLKYKVFHRVLNTADFGLPQTRRRMFMVCFNTEVYGDSIEFEFPKPIPLDKSVQDLLDSTVEKRFFLSEKILKTIMASGTKNYSAKPEINLNVARPLCATMHKMHRASQDNYYTDQGNRAKFECDTDKLLSNVRRLTPNECRKLQGFPDGWNQVVSDTQAYIQLGNAVSVDVSYNIAKQIVDLLNLR
jgi:DNA (cytosine-5)-methyltransferase 1